jgi:hypothetical protein
MMMSPGWVNSQTQQTTPTPWSSVWNLIGAGSGRNRNTALDIRLLCVDALFVSTQDAGDQHFSDSFVVQPFIQLDLAKDRRVFGELCIV